MKKLLTLALCSAGLFAGWSGQANAIQAVSGATNIDDYNVDIAAGGGAGDPEYGTGGGAIISSSGGLGVDTLGITGWSLTDFVDVGTPGISDGDTFTDYIVLRGDNFQDILGNDFQPAYGADFEITYEILATGEITSDAGAFVFDGLTSFRAFVDTANDGDGISVAAFGAADFTNFFDGQQILSGGSLVNLGVTQGGSLLPVAGANGSFSLAFEIFESTFPDFFLAAGAGPDAGMGLFDVWDQLFALPDGDLTFETGPGAGLIVSQFIGEYGIDPEGALLAAVSIDGDADIAARMVPAPGTVALLGLGLLGLVGKRRKLQKI